jgi:hypothetical protein
VVVETVRGVSHVPCTGLNLSRRAVGTEEVQSRSIPGSTFCREGFQVLPANWPTTNASTLIKMASTTVTSTSFCPVPHAFRDQVIDHVSPCRDATGPLSSPFAHIVHLHTIACSGMDLHAFLELAKSILFEWLTRQAGVRVRPFVQSNAVRGLLSI